jgi:hypothetical protein
MSGKHRDSQVAAAVKQALRRVAMDVPSWRALMFLYESSPRGVREMAERAAG